MKLKDALKKFKFLQRLSLDDKTIERAANHLARTLKGDTDMHITPLARKSVPIEVLVDWDVIFKQNSHKMNDTLHSLELANRSKFGPRSISVPWPERIAGLRASYLSQIEGHIPKFKFTPGPGNLGPISFKEAMNTMKPNSSAGFPYLASKESSIEHLSLNFDDVLERKDPCVLYTRTTEQRKTRNVWGYPFADTLYEMMFYVPILRLQKQKFCRASLISPELVAEQITVMIVNAMSSGKVLYSVDFAGFDASVLHQYIILAFDFIKSCYTPTFHPFITYVCERMYTIGIVTPSGIYRGKHGVPSGSTFTNEVDSIVQLGIAMTCNFIHECECMVQGDDGVYAMLRENIPEFEAAFEYARLKLEKSKSMIASNCVVFCQMLYHIDYINDDGLIGGIYPTYRAINRILFQEKYVDFGKMGVQCKDYYGIRCLQILERCKYHPLFEELVRFVLVREKYSLDVSEDGLLAYCKYLNNIKSTAISLNHQHGSTVTGIRKFEAYKLVQKILAEEEFIE